MSTNQTTTQAKKGTIIDAFIEGARNGFNIAMTSMMPNVVFAFALIRILDLTGLTAIIGKVFDPVMGLLSLPGIAATVLMASWLSTGGGVGVAASLYIGGQISGVDVTILLPAIMLMGSQVQYMGRILGTGGVKNKYYILMFGISILNSIIGMIIMNIFV